MQKKATEKKIEREDKVETLIKNSSLLLLLQHLVMDRFAVTVKQSKV